ncbi:MAG: hypothetical protein ACE5FG_04285 [Myxococcota bacterium]
MWSAINSACNLVFDLLLWPVQWLSETLQLCWLGVPAAILALVVFRYVSDQEGIEIAKDKIKAHLLELRLYKDDLRVTLAAQGRVLRHNLTYLRHALLPMAVMIVPFVLMIVQVESRFAYRGLRPGEAALLTVEVDGAQRVSQLEPALRLPATVEQETPPLRIDETGEIVWRLRAGSRAGAYRVGILLGNVEVEKQLVVDGTRARVSPAVYRSSDLNVLAYPGEPPLATASPVRAVHIDYPRARGEFAGLSTASWIFFAASMVAGFALRGFFGVTF